VTGMAPPKYKDLGKQANDILNEDFKFEHSLELKSKLNGVEVKSTFADKGKNGLTGEIECKKSVPFGDVTFKTDHAFAEPKLIVENSKLVSGLKIKATAPCLMEKLMDKGLEIAPEYKHDLFMLTAKADTKKKSSAVDVAFSAGPATAGIKTTLKANGSVSGTEVAVQYKAGDISVFGKYALDDKKASGSLHTSLSSDLDVAMEVSADQKTSMDLDLALGAQYKVDDSSSIKGKVDKAGIVNLCYVQKPRKDLELKVTAAINTGNLSGATAHKWGVQAIMSM